MNSAVRYLYSGDNSNITAHKMFWGHVRKHRSKSEKENLFTNRRYRDLCLPVSKILSDLSFPRFLIPQKPRVHCWNKRNAKTTTPRDKWPDTKTSTYWTLWRQHGLQYMLFYAENVHFIRAFSGSNCPASVCLIINFYVYS